MSRENLRRMGVIAGKRKGITIGLPKQKDASYMWKGASIHPMQSLQNIHQRTVREAVRLVEGDDPKRDEAGKQLGAFFYFEAAGPKLLPPEDTPTGPEFVEERLEAVIKSLTRLGKLILRAEPLWDEAAAGDTIKDLATEAWTELDSIFTSIPGNPVSAVEAHKSLTDLKVELDDADEDDLELLLDIVERMETLAEQFQTMLQGLACIANFHVIDTFYLWRLLVKYKFSSDQPIDNDLKADLSGEVTGLLHNGPQGATAWLTDWLTAKLVELDGELKALDSTNLFFYLKGGRALYYAMGNKLLGTNDFDTGIIINPNLPVDQWYELFRKVHNLCLVKLRRCKHELIHLMEVNADSFSLYLDAVELSDANKRLLAGNLDNDDDEDEELATLMQQLEPPEERTNGKAELIDIGMPRRDTPEIWETWSLKDDAQAYADNMPCPGPIYFINEYVMMIRDAFQPGSRSGKKSGKRMKRLADLIATNVPDAAVQKEVDHMPAALLPKSLGALGPFGTFEKAAKVLLKQFVDAHLFREDVGFCTAFDTYFTTECANPGGTPISTDIQEAAGKLGPDRDPAIAVARNVGCIHAFSGKIEKHIQDRGEFFRRNRKEFGRFVKAIYTASVFNKAEDELEIMFAIAGSFAARLHAEYADYDHMEDVEPFHRLDIKIFCKGNGRPGDVKPEIVMEMMLPTVVNTYVEAYRSHPETPQYTHNVAPNGALDLYWPSEETMGDLTYRPLVIRLTVEQRERDWPQLSFIWGYPVLSVRDLAWDYIKAAGLTEEFGARARLRRTADAMIDILTRYENPGTNGPATAPVPQQPQQPPPQQGQGAPIIRKEVQGMRRIPQLKPNWCWAAVSSIMRGIYANDRTTQDNIVQALYNNKNDQQGPLVLPGITHERAGQGVTLTWAQIKSEIDRNHPFIFASGAHYYVATGYVEQGASQTLLYWNPLPVRKGARAQMSYRQYVNLVRVGGATYWKFSGPSRV